jgi:hypothetical protein
MSQVIETHIQRRGVFGWFFLILFWAFNGLMLLWAVGTFNAIGNQCAGAGGPYREAQQAGTAIGGAIDGAVILFAWAAGAVNLGLFALLARTQDNRYSTRRERLRIPYVERKCARSSKRSRT